MRKMHHVAAACAISAIMLSGNVLAAAHSAQAPPPGATPPPPASPSPPWRSVGRGSSRPGRDARG